VKVVLRALENLLSFTKKAEKWADENNVSKEALVDGKLIDDMKVWHLSILASKGLRLT